MADWLKCDDPRVRHVRVQGYDCELHVAEYGQGPAVLMLHGFPDLWASWRAQACALADAGYRCVMPDMRGYGQSGAPAGIENYSLDRLVADAAAVIHERCDGECTVVGHDWGGVVAWQLAAELPDLVRTLVILNAPHPAAYRSALFRSAQLFRSWYVAAVQVPELPERVLAHRNAAALMRLLKHAGLRDDDVACYQRAFGEPDRLRGPLNYYRAAARQLLRPGSPHERVDVPAVVLWGMRDPYLDPSILDHLAEHVRDLQIERVADAGHFLHWEQPDRVNALLLEALRQDRAPASATEARRSA